MARRRRRRNAAGAFGRFIGDHPFLFTFFVLPTLVAIPIAALRIFRAPALPAAPTAPKLPPDIPIGGVGH